LEHPNKYLRVSCLAFVTAATSLTGGQPNFARCLAVSWAATLYMHFQGLLPLYGVLPGAKFTFIPSLAFSYSWSVAARHSSIVGVSQTFRPCAEGGTYIFDRAAITLDIGPHSSSTGGHGRRRGTNPPHFQKLGVQWGTNGTSVPFVQCILYNGN